MAYVPRIEVPNGYYHVTTRGNNRRWIYEDDRDRELFLRMLGRVARRYGWIVYAYCFAEPHLAAATSKEASRITRARVSPPS